MTMQPWRIDKNHLHIAHGMHCENSVARRLRLVCDDAHLFTNDCIDQRRFADVGPAHDGDESAATDGHGSAPGLASSSSIFLAAACSARRRVAALAVVTG